MPTTTDITDTTARPVTWSDEVDAILATDQTAALVHTTPAGGAVALPVSPLGLRDRAAGTVSFTTSRAYGRKLEHLARDPRVALCFHARDHGLPGGGDGVVVVQGVARVEPDDPGRLAEILERAEPFEGTVPTGRFWDWWLAPYVSDRVEVVVDVVRVLHDGAVVGGAPLPEELAPQAPPAKGTGPRVRVGKAARGVAKLPHRLLAYVQADGFPVAVPFRPTGSDDRGLRLSVPTSVPTGGRRAGLLAHRYNTQLVGMAQQVHTGWLEVGDSGEAVYAPHTTHAFSAPGNKTFLLVFGGLDARLRRRRASKRGA